ncbi:NAD-dependent formate dehydrogenase [Saccharopolyspora sp. HNM0983]|uniref:NAD-dependent formate dehydrogenase n=1 Tax=Saccharopolyspora montiporae TaxID=2781240 RepID=A0A929BEE2_9PSEU|nr:NAD-dependent formate dehydrogenase [Saccharopolyspora sp. HNM0983]MBE9376511.1 NAD-dependent formate dehydrogenase [Saccharopolyspora sp. HNM0983]
MKVVYVSYPRGAAPGDGATADAGNALGLRDQLDQHGHRLVSTSDTGSGLDEELADAQVLVTTPFWPVYLDAERLDRAPQLGLVITAGIGSDHVDFSAARERGIHLAEVTGSNVVSVAEHNVLQILALVRNFVPAHRQVLDGRWDVAEAAAPAHDLEGKTVGIVGLGAIGARTALRLRGFDVRMLYHARHRKSPAEEATLGVRYARFDDLVAESDVICLALPLTGGSRAMFDRERLAAMKPGAWLVNTARGAIVDRDDLVVSLESGHLGGYAGDTWYPQPAPEDHPWRSMPSHAMTIHYSGMTAEAQQRIAAGVREILGDWTADRPLPEDYLLLDPQRLSSADATGSGGDRFTRPGAG